MLNRLRARQEWQFFGALPKADPVLATVWWALLILNGAMPAIFAVAIGALHPSGGGTGIPQPAGPRDLSDRQYDNVPV